MALLQGASPKRVTCSGDTDCGSDGEDERGDTGYMSGAESDSGLVDARQSMNLVVRNLQVGLRRPFPWHTWLDFRKSHERPPTVGERQKLSTFDKYVVALLSRV